MWKQRANTLGQAYKSRSPRENLLLIVDRNLRKIGHNLGIQDPIGELLTGLSESTGETYSCLEDLDDVTLEGLSNTTRATIQELCDEIKEKSKQILTIHQ